VRLAVCVLSSNISHTLESLTRNRNMASIDVTFEHPTDNKKITAGLGDDIKGKKILEKLINNDFIKGNVDDFILEVKGGPEIRKDERIYESVVEDGDTVKVVPETEAGGTGRS